MCGRYLIGDGDSAGELGVILREANKRYENDPERPAAKTGEIFPGDAVPVLALERGRVAAGLMHWGFPKRDGRGLIINARAETAHERPMFARCLESRRCIIPSSGFFEWKHVDGRAKKDKYFITLPDQPVLYMAGLYSRVQDASGKSYVAFVILTTQANGSIAGLHDRMPVMLRDEAQREAWLRDYTAAREMLMLPDTAVYQQQRV